MSKKHIRFIVNPFSGTSKKGDFETVVKNAIDHQLFNYDVYYTEYPMHANILATEAKEEEVDIVASVGGDGTVNEIAAALVNTDIPLAIIPGGSGNGFGTYIGMPRNHAKAIKMLADTYEKSIDTCKCNGEFFINLSGVGFDAEIAYRTKSNKMRGFLGYFLTTIKSSLNYRPLEAIIKTDNEVIEGSYAAIIIANAKMYGYDFSIAPDAKFDVGLLELVLVKDAPVYSYFLQAPKYFQGKINETGIIKSFKTKSLNIKAKGRQHYHIDGEGKFGSDEFSYEILPKSMKILVANGTIL